MVFQIGMGAGGIRAREGAQLTGRHAHWTRAIEQIFGTDFQPPKQAIGQRVECLCPDDLEHCADLQMVLEVFPHWRVADHLNAVGSQQICRADTGEL